MSQKTLIIRIAKIIALIAAVHLNRTKDCMGRRSKLINVHPWAEEREFI